MFNNVASLDDCLRLQSSLDDLIDWSLRNRLPLNVTKCKVFTCSRSKSPIKFDYNINLTTISHVREYCDLGVTFDEALSFSSHIYNIVARANRSLGFIMRSCKALTDISALKGVPSPGARRSKSCFRSGDFPVRLFIRFLSSRSRFTDKG